MYVVKNEPDTGIAVALDDATPRATSPDNTGRKAKVALTCSDKSCLPSSYLVQQYIYALYSRSDTCAVEWCNSPRPKTLLDLLPWLSSVYCWECWTGDKNLGTLDFMDTVGHETSLFYWEFGFSRKCTQEKISIEKSAVTNEHIVTDVPHKFGQGWDEESIWRPFYEFGWTVGELFNQADTWISVRIFFIESW